MAQKINPNIFRLGINKTWNTEFFETKKTELPVYTFKNIEIKNYISKFLNDNGLILHSYKLHYNQSLLNIYISYFIPTTFKFKNINTITSNKNKETLLISKFFKGLNLFTKKKK